MALQTSHHSEPSSTPTSTPPPSPTDGATDPNAQSTSFSPAGSPPLILAFLAIGLFSAAMIVVFGWRRVQFGPNGWRLGHVPTTDDRSTTNQLPKALPNKPKLWDLWSDGLDVDWTDVAGSRKEGWTNEILFWENMKPLTANAVPCSDENEIMEKPIVPDANSLRRNIFNRSLFRMRGNSEPTAQPGGGLLRAVHRQSLRSVDTVHSTPPTSTLQVGFIIVMPSEKHPIHVSLKDKIINQEYKKGRRMSEITDYSIGMYDCPWDQ